MKRLCLSQKRFGKLLRRGLSTAQKGGWRIRKGLKRAEGVCLRCFGWSLKRQKGFLCASRRGLEFKNGRRVCMRFWQKGSEKVEGVWRAEGFLKS